MRILVTGGSGFIGSYVVDKLIEAGHEVRVLDLKEPHRLETVEFLKGNIISQEDVHRSLTGIEVVYHLAAFSNIDLVKSQPLTTLECNIMGTAYLLEECRKRTVKRFILASSVYVYSGQGHLYTTAKLACERLCQDYHALFSLPYTILRYGTAYGPRSRRDDVVSRFVFRALRGESLVILGSGKQKRNFIYVEDLALANVAALKSGAENQTYTLAGEEIDIMQLAETVRSIVGTHVGIEYGAAREEDYQGEVSGLNETCSELGWEPKTSLEEGIKTYVRWCRENGKIEDIGETEKYRNW